MEKMQKFSILITDENRQEVKRIADKAGINKYNYKFLNKSFNYYIFSKGSFVDWDRSSLPNCPEITLSQFKAMFEPEEREIIGYKVKDLKYKNPIWILSGFNVWDGYIKVGTKRVELFKELGVLDLWFTPVFKETYKTVMVGGKEHKIDKKDGQFFVVREKEGDLYLDIRSILKMKWESLLITFGSTATLSEIKNLVDTYKSLNK